VQHTPSTTSTQDCLSSLHSHDYELTPECSFSFRRASLHDRPPSLQTRSITAYKLARSRPPSVSPNSLDYGLQVRTIMASKCIYTLARSQPPSASPNSLDHGLQVHLQTRSITASKCISKLARSRPRSVSLSSLDRYFQAHLELLSSTACCHSRYPVCRWVAI